MRRRDWRRSRFDDGPEDSLGPLSNLADIMLVFAVGLIAALAASERAGEGAAEGVDDRVGGTEPVVEGDELPEVPDGVGEEGAGYESVGRVYRDPDTGRLIMVSPDEDG